MKFEPYAIIRTPLITEKSTHLQDHQNKVVFQVALRANKREIKEAVERIYNVRVVKVNTMRVKGKVRRYGRFSGRRPDWKKAVVTIHKDDTIDFLEGV
jgi:large subunit ribosomal protein L23